MNVADYYEIGAPGIIREYEPYEYDVDPSEEPGILGAALRLRLSGLPDWYKVSKAVREFIEKQYFMNTQVKNLTSMAPNTLWTECWNWSLNNSSTEYLWKRWTKVRQHKCSKCGSNNTLDYCSSCEAKQLSVEISDLLKRHRKEHGIVLATEQFLLLNWVHSVDGSEYWDAARHSSLFDQELLEAWPNIFQIRSRISQALRVEENKAIHAGRILQSQAPLPARAWIENGGKCCSRGCTNQLKGVGRGYWPSGLYLCLCADCARGHVLRQCARCGDMGAPDSLGVCLSCIRTPRERLSLPIVYDACTAQVRITEGRKPSLRLVNPNDKSQFCTECNRRLEWQTYKGGICPMCYQRANRARLRNASESGVVVRKKRA